MKGTQYSVAPGDPDDVEPVVVHFPYNGDLVSGFIGIQVSIKTYSHFPFLKNLKTKNPYSKDCFGSDTKMFSNNSGRVATINKAPRNHPSSKIPFLMSPGLFLFKKKWKSSLSLSGLSSWGLNHSTRGHY